MALVTKRFGGVEIKGPLKGGLTIRTPSGNNVLLADAGINCVTIECLRFNKLEQLEGSTESVVFTDNLLIEHVNDRTAKAKFDLSLISSNTTRTMTVPDTDITLGSGTIIGPITTTLDSFARWNDITGTLLKNSSNLTMNDNGELTFTELSNATKGIVFPDLLTDAFHFKDASGLTLLSFNSIDDLPQFPNSLELNNSCKTTVSLEIDKFSISKDSSHKA